MVLDTTQAAEYRRVARDFLAASDEAFDRDDVVEGSMKLWEAAAHAVTAAAMARGWPVGDRRLLKSAAGRLAKEFSDPMIAGGYAGAEEFSRHYSRDWMEDWQRDADRPLVHDFVERVLGCLNWDFWDRKDFWDLVLVYRPSADQMVKSSKRVE